jgi:nucleoside 2-deoxyribosyltransferase
MAMSTTSTIDIYLAGPIQHVQDYGKGWRKRLKEKYSDDNRFSFIDPMDKYDTMDDAEDEWTNTDIVRDDLTMIDDSDALLAHWDAVPTAGTPMEIFYARRYSGGPVAIQTTLHESDISPWIEYHSDFIVESFGEALETLHTLPREMYVRD